MAMPMGIARPATEMIFLALHVLAAIIRQNYQQNTRRKESQTWEIVSPVTLKAIKGMIRDVEEILAF
jgi:transcriptional antiterminator